MQRYPTSTPSQQSTYGALADFVVNNPACELWITLTGNIDANLSNFSAGSMQLISKIATAMASVFDTLHTTSAVLPISQYLLHLASSARDIAVTINGLYLMMVSGSMTITPAQVPMPAVGSTSVNPLNIANVIAINSNLMAVPAPVLIVTTVKITALGNAILIQLLAWDPAQGYTTPNNLSQLATQLMQGVTIT